MIEDNVIFTECLTCKKKYPHTNQWSIMADGTMICEKCTMEIQDSFSYYIGNKRVSKEKFKENTDEL